MHEFLKASAEFSYSGFLPEEYKNYRISIQLRLDGFSFAFFDASSNQLIRLQDYRTSWKRGMEEDEKWQTINHYLINKLDKEGINSQQFKSTKIIIDHKEYHLEPIAFYDEKDRIASISFNQKVAYIFEPFNHKVLGTESMITSAIPKYIMNTVDDYFEGSDLLHISSIIQNEVRKKHKNKKLGKCLYVYISNRDLHLIAMDEELIFQNSYTYQAKEDFIYFILLAYDQLEMNPEEHPMYFMGDISRTSALFNISWQYIRNIHFMSSETALELGSEFDHLPIHQYYLIIQSILCE